MQPIKQWTFEAETPCSKGLFATFRGAVDISPDPETRPILPDQDQQVVPDHAQTQSQPKDSSRRKARFCG